jgi:fermentation-respiration switch protein FrsA (DUF1100 family)
MARRDISFQSCGVTCRGWLYTPDEGEGPFPTVVQAFGGGYVKEFPVVVKHATDFANAGMAVISFDYRYFGSSDGEPRQLVDCWGQVEDCRNALSFAETLPEVDKERLGIWGISIGGGHALAIPAMDSRVKATVSVVPMLDGFQMQRLQHGDFRMKLLQAAVLEDRRRRFADESQRGQLPQTSLRPYDELCGWPDPDIYHIFYEHHKLSGVAPNYELNWQLESMENVWNYNVFPMIPRIINIPVLFVVAAQDANCAWDIAAKAYQELPTPYKEIFIPPAEISHMSAYGNPEHSKVISDKATEFLKRQLVDRDA